MSTRCLVCATAGITELLLSRTNLYVNCKGRKIWDFAAGALAVEEAGGVVKHIDGTEIIWDKIEMDILLVVNTDIAEEALRATSA